MGVLRDRPAAVAALLLAVLAFSGLAAEGHRHDPLAPSVGHEDLPTFAAGHSQPDHTVHIEGATRVESPACVVCQLRQRQRADASLGPALGGFEPSSAVIATAPVERPAAVARGLAPSRAPPRA